MVEQFEVIAPTLREAAKQNVMNKITQTEFERLIRLQKEVGGRSRENAIVNCDLTDVFFTEKELCDVVIAESLINNAKFDRSYDMFGMYWVDNIVKNTTFSDVNLNKSELWECTFDNCCFVDMVFLRVDFINTTFKNCTFTRSDFSNSWLSDVNFKKCTFIDAKFKEFSLKDICRDLSFDGRGK